MIKRFIPGLLFLMCVILSKAETKQVDVCIYGGTSAGVVAAYTAKNMGKSVLLIEPTTHIGGLTTGGLGFTDIGNKFAITGISRDFYRRIGKHYGRFEHWIFEPKVASQVFTEYLTEAKIKPLYNYHVIKVNKTGTEIRNIVLEHSNDKNAPHYTISAQQFIDCSYEGDLMAKTGVSYHIGRESNAEYNEKHNGVQLREKHQFPDDIDPYIIRGDSTSGLLWGISPAKLAPQGSGDSCVQAYNYRICLTDNPENRIEITQPDDYRPDCYELLLRYLEKRSANDLWSFLKMDRIGNNKTDINNNGPFSTDMIGMNHNYPDAGYEQREVIRREHENYTKGFIYFVANDPRMPEHLREQMKRWGYPKDEYTNNNHWSPQMYVREVRRMVGEYVMTQANCEGRGIVDDAVGMAAYTMDSHNCQRLVVNGMVKNEGDVQVKGFPPYPVAYRSLLPKANECSNLLVPVCLSASHIAYGSIRMEPVFMVLAQSAAVAAVLSLNENTKLHQLDVKKIQQELKNNPLSNGTIPEILIDKRNQDKIKITTENTVSFFPEIKIQSKYKLYVYLPVKKDNSVTVNVFDGKKTFTRDILSPMEFSGQHAQGDWVLVGEYHLKPQANVNVEVMNAGSDNSIIAEAVLFVPEAGK